MIDYEREYIPTPEPTPPPVIPTPTVDDNGKFLGVSSGEYSIEGLPNNATPSIIETASSSVTINTNTMKLLTAFKDEGKDLFLKFTSNVTIDGVTLKSGALGKFVSVQNKKYGIIFEVDSVFYFLDMPSTGILSVVGQVPPPVTTQGGET